MFKARLKEAAQWIVALILTLIIAAIPVTLVELTGLINKNIPNVVWLVLIIGFWVWFIGSSIWKWIKWQFIEPYKAAKAEKKGE